MKITDLSQKPIRVGVVGVGRGMSFASSAASAGMQLVALCDTWEEKLQQQATLLGVSNLIIRFVFI